MSLRGTTEDGELDFPATTRAQQFGRYLLEDELGKGGMGVVWAARDPDLDRRVALKLVRHRGSRLGTTRLKREAQAIARLAHPNVVTVHEVGQVDDQVYVAMELVEGASLRHWLARARRDLPAILEIFVQAARGLAAVHDAGLVHRDFKPDNVLVGDDGRVRVADFGLVRLVDRDDDDARDDGALGRDLTRTGAVVGTPRYMAPEQLFGEPVDARADQFAFCVTLYEAVARQRPFVAHDVDELTAALLTEAVEPFPSAASVPGWLERLIRRGLARHPERRYDSMHDLLGELTADHAHARRASLDGMARTDPMIAAFPPPAAWAAHVEALREVLERAWSKKSRGELAEASALADELLVATANLDYPPLRAAALYLAGDLAHRRGDSAGARRTLLEAARTAAAAADDWQVANAWVFLIVVALALGRLEEAEAYAEAAEVALARSGDNASLRTRLDNHRGLIAVARGELVAAAAWHRAAVARDTLTRGPQHPFLVISLLHLADCLLAARADVEAAEATARAAAIVGLDADAATPSRARCLELLATLARRAGRTDDADALTARAVAMRARLS